MIKSFKHKGLEKFYTTDSKAGIIPSHAKKLRQQLTALTRATQPKEMDFAGCFYIASRALSTAIGRSA